MFLWRTNVGSLILFLAAFSGVCSSAWGSVTVLPDVESGKIVEKVDWVQPDQHLRLTLRKGIPNHWFLFALRGVKGKTLAIDIVGQTTVSPDFPWTGIQPLVADTVDLSDPLLYDEQAYQQRYGHLPWRPVLDAYYHSKTRTLSLQAHFDADEATIALTYPCPVSYVENRLRQLRKASPNGQIGVYTVGKSDERRPLRVVTVPSREGPDAARWKTNPTVLLCGGEYATGHVSSQVVMGALEWLLGGDPQARKFTEAYNVLLIPQPYPDETVESIFGDITDGFSPYGYESGPENDEWAKFWDQYVDAGNRLDVAISFDNDVDLISNFSCSLTQDFDDADLPLVTALNNQVMAQFQGTGLDVDTTLGTLGNWGMRLAGWLSTSFGATANFYEVSDQLPPKPSSLTDLRFALPHLLKREAIQKKRERLSLTDVRFMGADTLIGIGKFFADPRLLARQRLRERKRLAERQARKAKELPVLRQWTGTPDWWTFNDML